MSPAWWYVVTGVKSVTHVVADQSPSLNGMSMRWMFLASVPSLSLSSWLLPWIDPRCVVMTSDPGTFLNETWSASGRTTFQSRANLPSKGSYRVPGLPFGSGAAGPKATTASTTAPARVRETSGFNGAPPGRWPIVARTLRVRRGLAPRGTVSATAVQRLSAHGVCGLLWPTLPRMAVRGNRRVPAGERAGGRVRGARRPGCFAAGDQAVEHVVGDRWRADAEQRHPEHPGETRDPERHPHLRPRPSGHHERDHTQDERERRHHDRPQPQPHSRQRRVSQGLARVPLLFGELDDQDGVLTRQPDEDHEPDLSEDVDLGAHPGDEECESPDAADGRQQTHRHHEQDPQRQRPRVVEPGQHQVGEDHGPDERVDGRAPLGRLQVEEVSPLGRGLAGERPLGGRLDGRDPLPGARSRRQVAVDGRGRKRVVPLDHGWADDVLHPGDGPEWDHLPAVVPHTQVADIVGRHAERGVGHDRHLPVAAETVELVDEIVDKVRLLTA